MIRTIIKLLRPTYRYRSAVTGKIVSKDFALENPDTTVRERVK